MSLIVLQDVLVDLSATLQDNVILKEVVFPFQILAEQEFVEQRQTVVVLLQLVEVLEEIAKAGLHAMQQGNAFLIAEMES